MRLRKQVEELAKTVASLVSKKQEENLPRDYTSFSVEDGRITHKGNSTGRIARNIFDVFSKYPHYSVYSITSQGCYIYDKEFKKHPQAFRDLVEELQYILLSQEETFTSVTYATEVSEEEVILPRCMILDKLPGIVWNYDRILRKVFVSLLPGITMSHDVHRVLIDAEKILTGIIKDKPSYYW